MAYPNVTQGGRLAALLLISVAVADCATASPSTPSATPEPTSAAIETPVASSLPSATPMETPAEPAPEILRGSWVAEPLPADATRLTLIIGVADYTIQGIDRGHGGISVRGDEITFLRSNLCNGTGTYQWTIDGDRLHFVAVGRDECPGRATALKDRTYTRMG